MLPAASPTKYRKSLSFANEADAFQIYITNKRAALAVRFCTHAFLSNLWPQPLQVIVTLPTPRGTRSFALHLGQEK